MDSEQLSTSYCYNSEHNSVLIVLETFLKTFAGDCVLKKEKCEKVVECGKSLSCL